MQTGVISFCDRINYNIKSNDTKDIILNDIRARYNIQVLQRHWFPLDDKGYDHLKLAPHFACLRSNGNPYYMYLTRSHVEDVPIIYFIDKKVHPTYQQPRIILGRGLFDISLFSNTILDGEMVKTKPDGKWIFLINDVIGYKGMSLKNKSLPERLEYAFDMLAHMHTPDTLVDCFSYKVKQYAYATKEGVDELIEMSKQLPYTTRGIYFWPHSAKYKPKLVNLDDSLIKSVVRKVKDVPDFRSVDPTPEPQQKEPVSIMNSQIYVNADQNEDIQVETQVLLIHKTDTPDVYEVYSQTPKVQIGYAAIPNLKVSKMMRAIFKDTTVVTYLPFRCKYMKELDKWCPISQSE
jgi:hypothetical protein